MQWKYRELKENRRKHCTRKLAIQTIALGEPKECTQIHDCSRQKSATEKLHRCSFKLRKIKSFKTLYHCKKSMAKSTEKKKQKTIWWESLETDWWHSCGGGWGKQEKENKGHMHGTMRSEITERWRLLGEARRGVVACHRQAHAHWNNQRTRLHTRTTQKPLKTLPENWPMVIQNSLKAPCISHASSQHQLPVCPFWGLCHSCLCHSLEKWQIRVCLLPAHERKRSWDRLWHEKMWQRCEVWQADSCCLKCVSHTTYWFTVQSSEHKVAGIIEITLSLRYLPEQSSNKIQWKSTVATFEIFFFFLGGRANFCLTRNCHRCISLHLYPHNKSEW